MIETDLMLVNIFNKGFFYALGAHDKGSSGEAALRSIPALRNCYEWLSCTEWLGNGLISIEMASLWLHSENVWRQYRVILMTFSSPPTISISSFMSKIKWFHFIICTRRHSDSHCWLVVQLFMQVYLHL